MTKTFGTNREKHIRKEYALRRDEKGIFSISEMNFFMIRVYAVFVYFSLSFASAYLINILCWSAQKQQKKLSSPFQPYISLACMLQLLDFLPQRRAQLFFSSLFTPPAHKLFPFASRAVPINTPQRRKNVPGLKETLEQGEAHFGFIKLTLIFVEMMNLSTSELINFHHFSSFC